MATTEERFASLESFRTETLFAYKDMALELVVVKGLGEDTIKRLSSLQRDVNAIRDDLQAVQETLSEHLSLLNLILSRLDRPKE